MESYVFFLTLIANSFDALLQVHEEQPPTMADILRADHAELRRTFFEYLSTPEADVYK